jgi:dUTP pyrophosphatase
MYTLEIVVKDPELRALYEKRANFAEDSGVDLYVPADVLSEFGKVMFLDHQIQCRLVDETGKRYPFFLYPRSSISKTPLMLANSVGIFDLLYNGQIIAALRHVDTLVHNYMIQKHTRLVQICAPDLSPLQVRIIDQLDETSRGTGGFGSTGQ